MTKDGRRFMRVPWFNTSRWNEREDLEAQGDPETTVFLAACTLVALHIKGLPNHQVLAIKEDTDGYPVSCAITDEVLIDTFSRIPSQSNPRRRIEESDGA